MTWKAGESGNPDGGRKQRRLFDETIRRAIAQEDGKRLRRGCEALLDAFAAGEEWAQRLLIERLDGKAPQPIVGEDDQPLRAVVRIVFDRPQLASPDDAGQSD